MPDPGIDARLRFLDKSARLLNGTVPATSAHLMLERNIVAEEHGKALNKSQTKDVCKVCGTISMSDVMSGSDLAYPHVASFRKEKGGLTPDAMTLGAQTKMECLTCGRVIVKSSPKLRCYSPGNIVDSATNAEPLENAMVLETTLDAGNSVTPKNLSSKRRAKTRKQSGLQAMLEKAKGTNTQSTDTGLNLMDLIKQT
ncbi:MAG: hypothetical protein Q9213_005402 [Squamulea squamosa]